MRKNKIGMEQNEFSILTLDDDEIMTVTLQSYFQSTGFHVDVENDPLKAIERIRDTHYDILLLDFLMSPICGDVVVQKIREFNKEIFIILLTGHRSLAPPIKTIRDLDIQGYYEKSDRFDQLELLVESCTKSIRQMRTISRYRDGLGNILDTLPMMYQMQTVDEILHTILQSAISMVDGTDGYIYLDQKAAQNGTSDSDVYRSFFKGIGKYAALQAMGFARFVEIANRKESIGILREGTDEGERIIAPLFNEKDKVFGVISVDVEAGVEAEIVQLLEIYAKQASSVLNNALLDALVRMKNEELEKAYTSLQNNYLEMINAIRSMVDAKDIYTRGHSDRVSYYAALLARKLGKREEFIKQVELAGLFHDIGKIGTPETILLKDSKLTKEEYELVKQHPKRGSEILSVISAFESIAAIIENHHERIDGKGYPKGIQGDEIPEESRMIAIADAFDAMITNRHYRSRLSLEQAKQELQLCKGTQLDLEMVNVFMDILQDFENIQQSITWTYANDQLNDISEENK